MNEDKLNLCGTIRTHGGSQYEEHRLNNTGTDDISNPYGRRRRLHKAKTTTQHQHAHVKTTTTHGDDDVKPTAKCRHMPTHTGAGRARYKMDLTIAFVHNHGVYMYMYTRYLLTTTSHVIHSITMKFFIVLLFYQSVGLHTDLASIM